MGIRVFSVVFIIAALVMKTAVSGMLGGLSTERPVTPDVQKTIDNVKPQVEEKLGREVTQFIGLSYSSQVVNGINYFVKVDIGEDSVVHIRVHKATDDSTTLHSIQYPKGRDHPISYF